MFNSYEGEVARRRHVDILADADLFRTFFSDSRRVTGRRGPQVKRAAASICRAVEAVTRCRWDAAARVQAQPDGGIPAASCAALQAIVRTVRGDVGEAERLVEGLGAPGTGDGRNPECWSVDMIARALLTYATGRRYPQLSLAALMTQLATMLPGTARSVCDFLCFSLALAAFSRHDAALASFLLGHRTHALTGPAHALPAATLATRAAFGFSIVALGDTETGRSILLAVSNDGERSQTPLVAGIVDAELVGLQSAAGDLTSATHWLARTRRFADRYDCGLLSRRAVEARVRPSILHEGG